MFDLHQLQLDPLINRSLEEDWGYGDWSSNICVPAAAQTMAHIHALESLTVAGIDVAMAVFAKVDPQLSLIPAVDNGQDIAPLQKMMTIQGSAHSILRAERVALNFLGRMCGIATMTRRYVEMLDGTKVQLLDSRKTSPGLRLVEKSATVAGGARNHRFGLCDGVIVKKNHIRAAGNIHKAVEYLLESLPPTLKIEVEVSNLTEVQEAIEAGADLIVLENMSIAEMSLAVRTARGRVYVEAGGNIALHEVREVAETGVDFISTGSIIHSAGWSKINLEITPYSPLVSVQ